MNEKLKQLGSKVLTFWNERTKVQKGLIIGSFLLLIGSFVAISMYASKPNLVPLYSQLTAQETGQIKENLDQKGITSEITDGGTTIKVPEKEVNNLKVQLAAEGIPKSGSIDYSFFKDKSGFGMTDNEFSVIERAAMQTELAKLIKNINGVKDANVMITLPEESMWVSQQDKKASASVVLDVEPGYQPDQKQVRALYTLVAKSVPNLPTDNIVIMDQNFNYYDLNNTNNDGSLNAFQEEMKIKKEVERNLQMQLQQMLGTMMGRDKVVVSVSADVDVKKETRKEDLVEPVDKENMEGIRVSAEKISETYNGQNAQPGGVPGTGNTDVPGYPGGNANGGNGNYEKVEDRVNYEVNRIHKNIQESPYRIRDLGVQVMVEPPNPKNPNSLPQQRLNDIQQILMTVVRTSIAKDELTQPLTDQDLQKKVYVAAQPFNGKVEQKTKPQTTIPIWVYIVGGALVLLIGVLLFILLRKRKREEEDEEEDFIEEEPIVIPEEIEQNITESVMHKRQLEKMAKEKPEDFARLLRSWLSED